MKKFFRIGSGKKKKSPDTSSQGKGSSNSLDHGPVVGYEVKEKDLGKLHKAAWTGDINKVKQLAKKSANPLDKDNRTPLHYACVRGHVNVVEVLLEWTKKVNLGDSDQKTPLMKAVETGNEECARMLLAQRGDPNVQDKLGDTCLHLAVRCGDLNLVELLMCHDKIDPSLLNGNGYTPLHESILLKNMKCLDALCYDHVNMDVQDKDGRTPLMLACQTGQPELAKLLCEYGTDISVKDKNGWTADDICTMNNNEACRIVLRTHGQDDPSSHGAKAATNLQAPGGFGSPVDAEGDAHSDTDSKLSEAAGGAVPDSWKDSDESDEELRKQFQQDQKTKEQSILHAIAKKKKAQKSALTQRGKSPRPSVEDISEYDELKDIENMDGIPQIQDGLPSPKKLAKSTSDTRTHNDSRNSGDVVLESDDVMVVEDFDVEEQLLEPRRVAPAVNKFVTDSEDELTGAGKSIMSNRSTKQDSAEKIPVSARSNKSMMASDWSDDEDESLFSNGNKNTVNLVQLQKQKEADKRVADEKKTSVLLEANEDDWEDNSFPLSVEENKSKGISLLQGLHNSQKKSVDQAPIQSNQTKQDTMTNNEEAVMQDIGISDVSDVSDLELSDAEQPSKPAVKKPTVVSGQADTTQKVPLSARSTSVKSNWDSDEEEIQQHKEQTKPATVTSQKDNDSNWDSGSEYAASPRKDDDSTGFSPEIDTVLAANKPEVILEEDVPEPVDNSKVSVRRKSSAKRDIDDEDSKWDSDDDDAPTDNAVDAAAFITQAPSQHSRPTTPVEAKATQPTTRPASQEAKTGSAQKAKALLRQGSMYDEEESDEEEEEEESTWEKERREERERKKHEEDERKARAAEQCLEELSEPEDGPGQGARQGAEGMQIDGERKRKWEQEWEEQQDKLRREAAEEMRLEMSLSRQQSRESLEVVDGVLHQQNAGENVEQKEQEKDSGVDTKEDELKQVVQPISPSSIRGDKPPQIEDDLSDEEYDHSRQLRIRREEAEAQLEQAKQQQKEQARRREQEQLQRDRDQQIRLQKEALERAQAGVATHVGGMDVSFEDTDDDMDIMPSITGSPRKSDVVVVRKPDDDDDDGLSYSSTEHEVSIHEDRVMSHVPSGRPDYSAAGTAFGAPNESVNMMRLQESIREAHRKLERERNARAALENKRTSLEQERSELTQKLEDTTRAKSVLEQNKIELESRIRNLQYSISEEAERRKNAEVLYDKCKQQLDRKEEQYTSELEAKQKSELAMRNMQMELRTALSTAKQLEEEKGDLARQLNHERDQRLLQERINEEQLKFTQSLSEDPKSENADALAMLESTDETERLSHDNLNKTKNELMAVKAELERLRARQKDDHDMLSVENDELHSKIHQLKDDIKLSEAALEHASMSYTVEIGTVKTDIAKLQSSLTIEKSTKDKLETELSSMRIRMDGAVKELEKEQFARSDLERSNQKDQEEWHRRLERREVDHAQLKESSQSIEGRLRDSDSKASRIENELAVANATLVERTNQLKTIQKELDLRRTSQGVLDENLKKEKEENARLQTRNESLKERVTTLQHETLTLRQQYDEARIAHAKGEGAENLNVVLTSLRSDQEKNHTALQEKNTAMNESMIRLKEELRTVDSRRILVETELRSAQHELGETHRKLSAAEASSQLLQKSKEQNDAERSRLSAEVDKLQSRLTDSTEKQLVAQRRVAELVERVEKSESNVANTSQQLAREHGNFAAMAHVKSEAEETAHKLEVEKAKLEAALNHETQSVQKLQKEMADSHQAYLRAEEELGNLRAEFTGYKLHMNEAEAAKNLVAFEAQDVKQMYETEVKSRSKLGVKIAELERSQQENSSVMDEERRRTRKAIDLRRAAEAKLEAEQQRCVQLQKEILTLRGYLKAAKKRLKDLDTPENPHNVLQANFALERAEMNKTLNTVRKQTTPVNGTGPEVDQVREELAAKSQFELNMKLQEVNAYLEGQAEQRGKLDRLRDDNDSEIRRDFERTKRELLDELGKLRADQQTIMSEKDVHEREAKRIQNLYENEVRMREKLMERLERSNKNPHGASFMAERQHYPATFSPPNVDGSYMLNNQWTVSKRSHGLNDLSAKIRQELDRSIAKHLEKGPHIDINPPPRTSLDDSVMSLSAFNKSRSEYLQTLQRNYFV